MVCRVPSGTEVGSELLSCWYKPTCLHWSAPQPALQQSIEVSPSRRYSGSCLWTHLEAVNQLSSMAGLSVDNRGGDKFRFNKLPK